MKSNRSRWSVVFAATITLLAAVPSGSAGAAEADLPVVRGEKILATVNGEPITLNNYRKQFASIHEGATGNEQVRKKDPAEILDRMINGMLVVQEAVTMGLDELPEVRDALEKQRDETLRSLLFNDRVRIVRTPGPKEVDRIYKDSVREIKGASILLDKEEDARSLLAAIKGGGDFAALVTKAVEEGKGKGSGEGDYVKSSGLPPEVSRIVSGLKAGEVSPVISTGKKFTILKVSAVRFPQDSAKRKEAEKAALQTKRTDALKKYVTSLETKYVKRDVKAIKAADFEAETPGFAAMLKDGRPVARIAGESPVTVKDWAESLNRIFFHGIEQAIKQKRLNSKKGQALEQILAKRVVLKEAKRKKLDRSATFRERVDEYRNELLFGVFVRKVIGPESRPTDEELEAFLREHIAEYTVPERIRLDLLVFADRRAAEDAIGKLREGADFQWMRTNAPGQAEPSAASGIMEANGVLVARSELPDGLAQAVAGAGAEDLRLHSSPKGLYAVIAVREVLPSRPEGFESTKDRLESRVANEKRRKALEDWMEKLRKGSRVEVHAKGERIQRLLLEERASQAPAGPGERSR